jgi:3-dehydroquinate synthetase
VLLAGLDPAIAAEVEGLLAGQGLPTRAPGLSPAGVLEAMQHDKKRARGAHRFVLLERVGKPLVGVEVADDVLAEAVATAVSSGE